MIIRFISLVGFFLFALTANGQGDVTFTAYSDAKEVVEGGVFEVSFNLKNANSQQFTPPSFKGFKKVNGPNNSISSSIINGVMSSEQTISYTLMAPKTGSFIIRPATIKTNNKTLTTKPLQIKVVKKRKVPAGVKGSSGEPIFIRIEPSDSNAFVGQQVILDYVIYTSKNIESYNLISESDYGGVFNSEIRRFPKQPERVVLSGQQYVRQIIRRVALFPQQAGPLEIEPLVIQVGVPSEKKTRRRLFFFRDLKYENVSSSPATISVRSLPAGAPEDFGGAVGRYTMGSIVTPPRLTTDDALSVKMILRGNGDPKQVLPQNLNFPKSFDVYDPKVIQDEIDESSHGLSHSKEFEWVVLPTEAGQFSLQPTFSYYDTDSMKYVRLTSNLSQILVSQGSNKPRERKPSRNDISGKENLIPIKTTANWQKEGSSFFGTPLFWILLVLPVGIYAFALYKNKQAAFAENIDPVLKKKQRAKKVAEQRLAKAKKWKDEGNPKRFYDEISTAAFGFVGDKLNLPLSELSKANIESKLIELKAPHSSIEKMMNILKTCEMALFARKDNAAAMNETYQQTVDVLADLEEIL